MASLEQGYRFTLDEVINDFLAEGVRPNAFDPRTEQLADRIEIVRDQRGRKFLSSTETENQALASSLLYLRDDNKYVMKDRDALGYVIWMIQNDHSFFQKHSFTEEDKRYLLSAAVSNWIAADRRIRV